ncbi:G-protein alpha subunit [Mycena pura]|uniref:G-protein alpha subunit n=1 Tax=Mycena pura TaxID=153505 RepID=A0AAD6Y773_9AGAR|nr:G-protein alpha subunit [Mycena pura]
MVARTHRAQLSDDPFALALQPPPNETPAARQERVERELEEKRVSDQIDEDLRRERAEGKKRSKREVKVLLLGQSESGKSTVLKNFRLKFAPSQWKAELRSWRAVIQLNLIHNVILLLDVVQERLEPGVERPGTSASTSTGTGTLAGTSASPSTPPARAYGRASIDSTVSDLTFTTVARAIVLSQKHRLLYLRLSPLRKVADDLRRRLGADDPEFTFANGEDGPLDERPRAARQREFGVRGWIGALGFPASSASRRSDEPMPIDEPTEILATVRDDIIALWEDPDVRELLTMRNIRIEDRPGFFLSDTARITSRTYVPSDNDVVRARLRTLGVQEWRIMLENSDSFGSEWVIYDVGGARSVRHAWLPYFDAVNAIIFPISCFDERLAEDASVNRLEDTLMLWKAIVSSKVLGKTTLIVFLNKCDLLKRKLQSGIMVNKYLISFGQRENEVGVVVKYIKDKLKDILRAEGSQPRTTYLYPTSVTDTKATAVTLNIVRDGIIREHLKNAEFL